MMAANMLHDLMPQVMESVALHWPCKELCLAVMDTCACGKQVSFSSMLNKALSNQLLKGAVPFDMGAVLEMVMPAMDQMTLCDAFLWRNHTEFTGECNVEPADACTWCSSGGDNVPDLVAELIADQVADVLLDVFIQSDVEEDLDEDHVDEWEEELEEGDFEVNSQHHYTPDELDEIEKALLDIQAQEAKDEDRNRYNPSEPPVVPEAHKHKKNAAGTVAAVMFLFAASAGIGYGTFRYFRRRETFTAQYTDLSLHEYSPPESA